MAQQKINLSICLLYLYIVSLPFFGFSFLNVGERGLARPDWLVGALLMAYCMLESLRGTLKLPQNITSLLIFLYIVTGLVSGLNILGATMTGQFVDFMTKAFQLLLVTPMFFAIASLPMDEQGLRSVLRLWVFLACLIALHAIYQLFAYVFDLPFKTFELTNPGIAQGGQNTRTLFGYTQPTSIFREPSYLGAFLGLPFILATTITLSRQAPRFFFTNNRWNWLLVFTLALAILLSNSQAILVSLLIVLAIMLTLGLLNRMRFLQLLALTVVGSFLVGLGLRWLEIDFLTALTYRMNYLVLNLLDPQNTAQVTSFADRLEGVQAGLTVWWSHPLLGVGLGNMAYYSAARAWTNNAWLQILVEQGLLGLLALLGACMMLGIELWQLLQVARADPFWRPLLTAMLATLLLNMVSGLFTYNWTDPLRILPLAMAQLVTVQAGSTLRAQQRGRP